MQENLKARRRDQGEQTEDVRRRSIEMKEYEFDLLIFPDANSTQKNGSFSKQGCRSLVRSFRAMGSRCANEGKALYFAGNSKAF